MTIRTVVLDFDGTCTDVEREAQGFIAGYKRDLAALLGVEDVEEAWSQREAQILAEPSRHGMVMDGKVVAPPVDLYLLATAVSTLMVPGIDDETTERLFKENYRFTNCHFKPEARAVVEALTQADVSLHVVTNSDPGAVGAKLDEMAPRGRSDIGLHGNARKFLVTEPSEHAGHRRFARVPEVLEVPDWNRPVFARRGQYFDALQSIWQETGTRPQETLVVGDVFELDLALPAALGCRVHLSESSRTLDYERRAVEAYEGSTAPDLGAVLAHLG